MNERSEAIPAPGPDATALDLADMVQEQADIIDRALRDLRDLPVPAGDGKKLDAIFQTVSTVINDAHELAASLRRGITKAALDEAFAKLEADTEVANAASAAYGLTVCAE
jgi:hypothetical protein